MTIGGDNNDLYNKIDAGELDFVVDGIVPPEELKKYSTTPELQGRLNKYNSDAVRYLSFNIAQPPFDDVNVRKAVNYAIDKAGMRQLRGGPLTGDIAGHIMVNSLLEQRAGRLRPVRHAQRAGRRDEGDGSHEGVGVRHGRRRIV